MDIAGTIGAVASALTVVKELRDIDAQLDQATLKLKVPELTSALADAKLGLSEVSEQIRDKDRQIAGLKKDLRFRVEGLVEYRGFRYASAEGTPVGAPFCPICEQEHRFVRLVTLLREPGHPAGCPHCRAQFGSSVRFFNESDAIQSRSLPE